nr:hypothetical protein [Vibrio parahaemolyticus]
MDKEALMSEIKELEKREDYRGLIVKIEKKYPKKLDGVSGEIP